MIKNENEILEENNDSKILSGETYADSDSLTTYLSEIGKYKLFTNEETESLFKMIEEGDRDAYDKIVAHNLKLVVKFAKNIKQGYKSNIPLMDLIQAGNIGLMKAVDKFDYRKGYAFSTYAIWWIRQSITRHIYESENVIRVPVHMSEKFTSISKAEKNYKDMYGRDPDYAELSASVKMTKKEYNLYKSVNTQVASLNYNVGDDDDCELMNFVHSGSEDPVYDETSTSILKSTISEALDEIEPREAKIIKLRYGLDGYAPMTLEEIGNELGITRERVRQLETIAMKKLRNSVITENIRAFA